MNRNFRNRFLCLFFINVLVLLFGCGYHRITSDPTGADVFNRHSSIDEKPGAFALGEVGETPISFSAWKTPISHFVVKNSMGHWYQVRKSGYEDSEIIFLPSKLLIRGENHHFVLVPSTSAKPERSDFVKEYRLEKVLPNLRHSNPNVRINAIKELGYLNNQSAVEPLIALLKDKVLNVRRHAALALGKIKDSRALTPLIEMLKNDREPKGRGSAAKALGLIGDLRALEPLINALKDPDSGVRSHTAASLGNIGDKRAIEPLIHSLEDSEWSVRRYAASSLSKITGQDLGSDREMWQQWWKQNRETGAE